LDYTLLSNILIFFPLVILLDYHKRNTIKIAITYLLLFYSIGFIVVFILKQYNYYIAFLLPILFLIIILLRTKKESK